MFKGPIYETESNRLDLSDYVRPHSSLNLDVRENEDSTKTLEIADFHSLQVFFFFLQKKNWTQTNPVVPDAASWDTQKES